MNTPTLVAANVAGVVEHPGLDNNPYLVDADGRPYVPIGDGGVVLGISLGDSVFAFDTDHASAAVSLVHPDPAARYALTAFACLGNAVTVRSGAAAGEAGVVLGKRGEQGRVLAWFPPETLATIVPGDAMSVRAYGQGAGLSGALAESGAELLNVDPGILSRLGVQLGDTQISASVRGVVGSEIVGNGLGRPAHQWDLDLQVDESNAGRLALQQLAIGDLVAVADLDVRHNAGYRRGWVTVGVVVTTTSPRPGHGVGIMPILSAPRPQVELDLRPDDHVGVSANLLTELVGR